MRVLPIKSLLLLLMAIATSGYSMTGLVYFEGSFDGALVVKPYPMFQIAFGGGEEGTWARHHPAQPLPWFMRNDLKVVSRFSWEYGDDPLWVSAYQWGFLTNLLALLVIPLIGAVKIVQFRARANPIPPSIKETS
jgi:hypothetical protein